MGGDLFGIIAYSLHDCLTACAKYNDQFKSNICDGVVFGSNMTRWISAFSSNCYLKNQTTQATENSDLVSAVLTS